MADQQSVTVTDAGAPRHHVNVRVDDEPAQVMPIARLREHIEAAQSRKEK